MKTIVALCVLFAGCGSQVLEPELTQRELCAKLAAEAAQAATKEMDPAIAHALAVQAEVGAKCAAADWDAGSD